MLALLVLLVVVVLVLVLPVLVLPVLVLVLVLLLVLVLVLLVLVLVLLLCAVLLPVLLPELPSMAQGDAFHGMCPPAPHQALAPPLPQLWYCELLQPVTRHTLLQFESLELACRSVYVHTHQLPMGSAAFGDETMRGC